MLLSQSDADTGKLPRGTSFLKKVLDGMQDWVRVIDDTGAVIYMNHALSHFLENSPEAEEFFKEIGNAPVPDATPLSMSMPSPPYPGRFLFDGGRRGQYGWRSRGDFVRTVDVDVDVDSDGFVYGGALVDSRDRTQIHDDAYGHGGAVADDDSMFAEFDEMRVADKEIRVGRKVYAVISSPLTGNAGDEEYTVEVFRDVTRLKNLQHKITEQNQKFEYDLDMAKMLQRRLLPAASPNPRIGFQYIYRPCDMLGGDFVDIYNIGDDHLGVYIADVSGHGVSASVLTVFLRSTISKRMKSPAEALNALYREYNKNNFEPEVYITVFYAIFDLSRGVLKYANAGHNAIPMLYNKDRRGEPRLLRIPGLPISNWMEQAVYTEERISVRPGDMLFMFTDGLVEIKNKEKEMFGPERVDSALRACDTNDTSIMLLGVLQSAFRFAGIESKSMLADDVTMSFIEVR